MSRGFGLATGKRVGCSVPVFAACAGVAGDKALPTAIPAPTKAGITVVDRSVNFNDLTDGLLFSNV
jgi:hypothetical protein